MDYQLVRSYRKTLCAEVLRDGTILVRAPKLCPVSMIENFLEKNRAILVNRQKEMLSLPPIPSISAAAAERLRERARDIIVPRLEIWSQRTGLTYQGVKITLARGRYGSCSGTNSLCFSAFLALSHPECIDYVIVHELCHTVEHNHSPRFYKLVAKHMPDCKIRQNMLRQTVIPEIKK